MIQPAQARGALEGGPAVQRYDGRRWAGLVPADAGVELYGCTPTLAAAED